MDLPFASKFHEKDRSYMHSTINSADESPAISRVPSMCTLNEVSRRLDELSTEDTSSSCIAVLTSGGDAPGMNAAVRALTAVCLMRGRKVFAIRNGYKGLVNGEEFIRPLTEKDIEGISELGGTAIGSSRCPEFRTREGRLKAARNLLQLGISNLVVIGGDGSLTGANLFKSEWASLLEELDDVDSEVKLAHQHLQLIGMVGSIDNDLIGFSMTIGADTALTRIIEAVDALVTTAQSHERTFIVEVMGRNCGWLALMTAIACGADYVLIPEQPPDVEDWETKLCDALVKRRANNYSLVILAEGATDRVRRPILASYLKEILSKRLGHDTRITRLGHVQRGGAPSAYDRVLGSRCGAEAAFAILSAKQGSRARIIGIQWNRMVSLDLEDAVFRTRKVNEALENRDFQEAVNMRGAVFKTYYDVYMLTRRLVKGENENPMRIGILHLGAPAPGMNSVVKTLVRVSLSKGHIPVGIYGGLRGLVKGEVSELKHPDVSGWARLGGAKLGTNRSTPQPNSAISVEAIAKQIAALKLDALAFVGGFEAYASCVTLVESRSEHPELSIPMSVVPVTISNNVPGTDYSVGSDTALNGIVGSLDRLKQSAESSRRRVFIVETMGGFHGYLATLGALAGAADDVYIHEEGVRIVDMNETITHLRKKFACRFNHALVVRNELCSPRYTTNFMQALFEEEGRFPTEDSPAFTVRNNVLGHLLEGGAPTALDRVRGAVFAFVSMDHLIAHAKDRSPANAVVVGIGRKFKSKTVLELKPEVNFKRRKPLTTWSDTMVPLVRLLQFNSQRAWNYKPEAVECEGFGMQFTTEEEAATSKAESHPLLPTKTTSSQRDDSAVASPSFNSAQLFATSSSRSTVSSSYASPTSFTTYSRLTSSPSSSTPVGSAGDIQFKLGQ